MKVIQAELKNYNRRADNSVSLRLDSLIEYWWGALDYVSSSARLKLLEK